MWACLWNLPHGGSVPASAAITGTACHPGPAWAPLSSCCPASVLLSAPPHPRHRGARCPRNGNVQGQKARACFRGHFPEIHPSCWCHQLVPVGPAHLRGWARDFFHGITGLGGDCSQHQGSLSKCIFHRRCGDCRGGHASFRETGFWLGMTPPSKAFSDKRPSQGGGSRGRALSGVTRPCASVLHRVSPEHHLEHR